MADSNAPGQQSTEPEPVSLPDYMTNPDAVAGDKDVLWRGPKAPDYTNTRKMWAKGKKAKHAPGSLPELVENLVKNWEVEASFKMRLSDWRTIDHDNYTFSMNGEPPQSAEHMLKVGTYNAIITPSEYYDPNNSDFASSHKTFKRMMQTFAWEVLEVFGGPPRLSFTWRHWGEMTNDYIGFNDKGEKVTAKAHGGPIEIFGITTATVNDKFQLQGIDTYMDPLQMFRQIAPKGIVNKHPMNRKVGLVDALDAVPEEENKLASQTESATAAGGSFGAGGAGEAAPSSFATTAAGDESKTEAATATDVPMGACPFGYTKSTAFQTVVPQSEVLTINTPGEASAKTAADDGDAMKVDSEAPSTSETHDTATKEDTLTLPDASAGATTEALLTPPVSSQPASDAATSSFEVPQTAEKRSFDSTQEAGNIIEPSIPLVKRAANDTNIGQPSTSDYALPLDGQAPVGTQAEVHPHPKDVEEMVKPVAGEAVAAPASSEETKKTHEEMGKITAEETEMMNTE